MFLLIKRIFNTVSLLCIVWMLAAASEGAAATIPPVQGNVSQTGFTRLSFCRAIGRLYAFNGLNLYQYESQKNIFSAAFANIGAVTDKQWDPADFTFSSDGMQVILPTGYSGSCVVGNVSSKIAQEKHGLNVNLFGIELSPVRNFILGNEVYIKPYGSVEQYLSLIETEGNGSTTKITSLPGSNSGGICFDGDGNCYVCNFTRLSLL